MPPAFPASQLLLTRRQALGLGLGFAGAALAGCKLDVPTVFDPIDLLRINARPGTPASVLAPGQYALDVAPREALMYVPTGYDGSSPFPVVLMLHGAGGSAQGQIDLFKDLADANNLVLVAAKSKESTWDGIFNQYDLDIPLLNEALGLCFQQVLINPAAVYIEGFSDGGSYAIQIGRANGDLFSRVIAFSPGRLMHTTGIQRPKFYVSAGLQDEIIATSTMRSIAEQLATTYVVTYKEFTGGHTVPSAIAADAVSWLFIVEEPAP